MPDTASWTILVYRIPPHPTKLRLAIWRRLQKLGALYLQDGVTLLPDRDDLTENVTYIAQAIQEVGGECHLFAASTLLPNETQVLIGKFREQAAKGLSEIGERLDALEIALDDKLGAEELIAAEEVLRRERTTFLRLKTTAHFGSDEDAAIEGHLEELRQRLVAQTEGC